ncbi:MAG TPA: HPF/RaiA family ribosome-associated protein [Pelomicrobium sp.]|nr:HPF/RaiA family ribosome-associated protein [Pelomicrobium sp.]
MQTPPEIIFHDVSRSAWIEDYIRKRVARLDRLSDDLISCHVIFERQQHSQHKGNTYRITVNVRLPRHKDLAVNKDRVMNDMDTELRALIRGAFEAIERQLKEALAKRRREVKTPADEEPRGLIETIHRDDGFGFIRGLDQREFYFHRNSVLHDDFDRLEVGTEVRFMPQMGEEGPQASSVQIVGKPGARAGKVR